MKIAITEEAPEVIAEPEATVALQAPSQDSRSQRLPYAAFLDAKTHIGGADGFPLNHMPAAAFDFQRPLIEYAVRQGRAALFADCGLGKTLMEMAFAENVVRHTNGRVLILTPLAVAQQFVTEGAKFGYDIKRSPDGKIGGAGVYVTNYERLHYFKPEDFAGVVCDESSAIKAFNGERRRDVTAFMRKVRYRLLATATAAPNDYIELGTASEALGVLGQRDMLGMFFKSTDGLSHVFHKNGDFWNTHKWTFKAHSETPFWRWVCSWARAIRKPSDYGFSDGAFVLPPLNIREHVVNQELLFPGEMLPRVAHSLKEQRAERRMSMERRCELVAELVNHDQPAVVWCHLNDEGDALEAAIPGCVQIAGSGTSRKAGASEEPLLAEREEALVAFASGQIRVLVTKPRIGAFGLNWQHCAHQTFFPSHSYEEWYQAIRRCYRFGQKRPVKIDVVTTPGEAGVSANLARKSAQAEAMFDSMLAHMREAMEVKRSAAHTIPTEVPSWL